jgi:hypothetical protein
MRKVPATNAPATSKTPMVGRTPALLDAENELDDEKVVVLLPEGVVTVEALLEPVFEELVV